VDSTVLLSGKPLISIVEKKNTMDVNGYRQPTFFKISYFMFSRRRKKNIIHFWVNYPFNMNHNWSLEEKKTVKQL